MKINTSILQKMVAKAIRGASRKFKYTIDFIDGYRSEK